MKKIVKPHKARKPSVSTGVPSFARGKDQILKSPARLQRHKKNELGEFDTGKDNFKNLKEAQQYIARNNLLNAGIYVGNESIPADQREYQVTLPDLEIVGNKPTIWDKIKNWFTNATIGAAMAENPSVMTASGWKQNSNGDWIQSPDEGSRQLADDLAVISSFSPTNYSTAVGDALISKVGYPLYQLVKNKQLLPYIKSYLNHPTWQTYYHGSPIPFNVNEAKMGTPADMGLHVTRNKDVTNNFGGISYKMRAPRPKVTTSDLWANGVRHLDKDYVFFKPYGYSHTDFNIADKQLLDDLNKSGIKFKLENPRYSDAPDYRRLAGTAGQEFRINPRSRLEKAIPKSKRAQFNEEADKLIDMSNNIDLNSPAASLLESDINAASAKLLDKYGLTTVKYFNRNPYEGALPAYWINNPNKIDVLYNYNTMNTIHGLSSPITAAATDQLLYNEGKDDNSLIKETVAYNAWRQTLPKNLQRETPTYDLYGAYKAGLEPGWVPEDKSYHLGSRDPRDGRILKSPTHESFFKALYLDSNIGYYPVYRNGQIYTEQPVKYVDISKYKGGKDEPWYDKLNDSSIGSIIKIIDPTGVSSYYDVYKAGQDMYNNPSWSNAGSLAIETLGAIPLVGKFGKAFKLGNKLVKSAEGLGEDIGKGIFNWLGPRLIPGGKDMYDNHQSQYNKGKDSGIHIKKKNRGKFTALKKRTGKSASWFKEHGTPAQKKMAVFALNARKWKH